MSMSKEQLKDALAFNEQRMMSLEAAQNALLEKSELTIADREALRSIREGLSNLRDERDALHRELVGAEKMREREQNMLNALDETSDEESED